MGLVAAIVTDFLNSAVSKELKVFYCTKLQVKDNIVPMMALGNADFLDSLLYNEVARKHPFYQGLMINS